MLNGQVESARPLTEGRINELNAVFSRVAGQSVELHLRVSPEIIGGVKVTLQGKIYDGSIKKQLNIIERLLSPGIGR